MRRGRVLCAVAAVVIASSCGDDEGGEVVVGVDAGDAALGNGGEQADGAAGEGGQAGGNGGMGNDPLEDAASDAGNGGNAPGGSSNGGEANDAGPDASTLSDAATDPTLDGSLQLDASVQLDASQAADASPGDAAAADADANSCPARGAGELGGPCSSNAECDSSLGAGDGECASPALGWTGWPAEGFCLTVDYADCSSPCVADPCGQGDVCVVLAGCTACAPACCEGDTCASGRACSDRLGASPDSMFANACVPGDADAVVAAACQDLADCKPGSVCRLDAEHPGGECSTSGCTLGDDASCVGGGHCIDENALVPHCAKVCDSDVDCRLAEGYVCADLGGAIGKVCRHGRVGDACVTDTGCGDPAIWDCRTGPGFTGGYCTLLAACPTLGSSEGCTVGSSVCATGNYCVDRCATINVQSTCRTGYICQDTDPTPGGTVGGCLPP